jgi:hypothetical protein
MTTFTHPIRKTRVLADTLVPARTTLSWPTASSCNRTTGSPGRHLCVFTSDMRLSGSLLLSYPLVQCRVFRWDLHDKWEFPASLTCTTKPFSDTPRPSYPSLYEMRKSHKKSRLGCQTCKKRKIKVSSTHHLLTGTLLICRVPLVRRGQARVRELPSFRRLLRLLPHPFAYPSSHSCRELWPRPSWPSSI